MRLPARQLELALDFCTRPALSSRSDRSHGDGAQWLQQQVRVLLRSLGADKLAREVRVEWNPRLKTAAGHADYREKLISLNPLLLGHASDEIDRTLDGIADPVGTFYRYSLPASFLSGADLLARGAARPCWSPAR